MTAVRFRNSFFREMVPGVRIADLLLAADPGVAAALAGVFFEAAPPGAGDGAANASQGSLRFPGVCIVPASSGTSLPAVFASCGFKAHANTFTPGTQKRDETRQGKKDENMGCACVCVGVYMYFFVRLWGTPR